MLPSPRVSNAKVNFVLCISGGYLNTNLAYMFRWLRYVSMFAYSLSALAVVEFQLGSPLGFVTLYGCCLFASQQSDFSSTVGHAS